MEGEGRGHAEEVCESVMGGGLRHHFFRARKCLHTPHSSSSSVVAFRRGFLLSPSPLWSRRGSLRRGATDWAEKHRYLRQGRVYFLSSHVPGGARRPALLSRGRPTLRNDSTFALVVAAVFFTLSPAAASRTTRSPSSAVRWRLASTSLAVAEAGRRQPARHARAKGPLRTSRAGATSELPNVRVCVVGW